jgi:hypothetical protein
VAVRYPQHDVQQQQQETAKAVDRLLLYLAILASHFFRPRSRWSVSARLFPDDSVLNNDLNVVFRAVVVGAENKEMTTPTPTPLAVGCGNVGVSSRSRPTAAPRGRDHRQKLKTMEKQ